MRLRPYISNKDFDIIKNWITDERTFALWCANLMPYPLERKSFDEFLAGIAERFGDAPFVAENDEGEAVGFFCYSRNAQTNEGMLKFVMVSPGYRGKISYNHLIDKYLLQPQVRCYY